MAPEVRLAVLYDADCGVCRLTARALRMLDWRGSLRLAPLQGFVATAAGDPTRGELAAALHVRDGRGGWHAGGGAALRIAGVVPALAPLALVGRLPGMARIAETAYDAVARNRHAISGWLGVERCRFDPDRLPE